ncbi:MAG: hypothetical protein H7Y17_00805 [Chlorobia bacterium]|nr:hypothetical protein [Fimbriimonadaceae bacterium]
MKGFFADSEYLDHEVLRPLSHIQPHWELTWNGVAHKYAEEEDSLHVELNLLTEEIEKATPPARYHDNEDALAQFVIARHSWPIQKVNGRWVGVEYQQILAQGGFGDEDEKELLFAAAGRAQAAINRGQTHYDAMEAGHRKMLGAVLCVILYHRSTQRYL